MSWYHQKYLKPIYKMDIKFVLILLFTSFSSVQSGIPGTFFWRPRLGLDLSIPTAGTRKAHPLTKQNIIDGYVVAIEGYQFGMTVMALALGISSAKPYAYFNPSSAYFYTNSYRWGLRHLSLVPVWLGGIGNYGDTHKVWRRRFYYMDRFVPKWLRYVLPYVDDKEWKQEEIEYKRFKKYSEAAFVRPTKVVKNFDSKETQSSEISSSSSEEK